MIGAAGAVAGQFLPVRYPNNRLWLDGMRNVTFDGPNDVSQWDDGSGIGHDVVQAVGSEQPTYVAAGRNGLGMLSFDKAAFQHLKNASGGFATDEHTIIVAAKSNLTVGTVDIFGSSTGIAIANGDVLLTVFNNKVRAHYWDTGGNGNALDGVSLVGAAPRIFAQVLDATTLYVYLDGALENSNAIVNSKAGASRDFNIGTRYPGYVNPFDGDMYEVIVFDRAISATEMTIICDYLARKWAIS